MNDFRVTRYIFVCDMSRPYFKAAGIGTLCISIQQHASSESTGGQWPRRHGVVNAQVALNAVRNFAYIAITNLHISNGNRTGLQQSGSAGEIAGLGSLQADCHGSRTASRAVGCHLGEELHRITRANVANIITTRQWTEIDNVSRWRGCRNSLRLREHIQIVEDHFVSPSMRKESRTRRLSRD
nr:MAG TPA: hypothetical protein [Caudoviricetes sp.]